MKHYFFLDYQKK